MKLQPSEPKNPHKFETLVCELIESGHDVSLQNDQNEIVLWLSTESGWTFVLTRDGKWRLE